MHVPRPVRSFLTTALAVVAAVATLLLVFQERLIYFPRRASPAEATARAATARLEPIEAVTAEGRQLAYFAPPADALLDRLWVVFGGNGSVAFDWIPFCLEHAAPGRGFLLVEYPGYGANEGAPSPAAILEAALALYDAFVGRHGAPRRVAVLGHSLGGANALAFAAERGIARAVVAACFTDMLSMARRTVGWPLCNLLRHRYDNVASLGRLAALPRARVTLLHGGRDEVVPVAHGRTLRDDFGELVEYHELPGARHNDVFFVDPALVRAALDRD